ncbi:hypothetical protein [Cohnella zeiphila]|uniref:Glycosyltransferase RgtA/B/C/D-like domain-containing protein n=1 Tax=Cohnella zeiphila TaxID=2761120 RepID=A0A7X0VVL4_9BACL|nr:hypothetical protein [Cohnella zeiphila]MBB6732279.1 hypothetical protein [Cohnella zeiphila]
MVAKIRIKGKYYILIIILLTFLKLWLVMGQSMTAIGNAGHDDRLFLNLSNALLSGEWLGSYNNLTLAKGPFYPIWIALSFISGLPLLISEHLFYIFSVWCLAIALKPIMSKRMICILYVVLLFNPISYADGPMTRVIREGIYPALTLIVISSIFGLFIRRDEKNFKLLWWSLVLGVSFSCFWLTREEGIWIIPLIIGVYLFLFLSIIKQKTLTIKRIFFLFLVPIIVWAGVVGTVSLINKAKYGVFNVVEFRSNDFVKAYSSLTRVKVDNWNPVVPVPKEAREKIYQVSPLFAELRPYLEGKSGENWIKSSERKTGDIEGGWFMWALRDAVSLAGYYQNGKTAEHFYKELADQVNYACYIGELVCGPERKSMQPPWNKEYFKPLMNTLVDATKYFVSFSGFSATSSMSVGDENLYKLFDDLTNNNKKSIQKQVLISGWAFQEEQKITLQLVNDSNEPVDSKITYSESEDVFQYFLNQGSDFNNAKQARFQILAPNYGNYTLNILEGSNIIGQVRLKGTNNLEADKLHVYIDSVSVDGNLKQDKIDSLKIKILNAIGKLYQYLSPVMTALAIVITLASLYLTVRKGLLGVLSIASILLLGTILIRLGILSMIDVSSFPAINVLYLSSAYPLLLFYIVISVAYIPDIVKSFKKPSS